MAYESRIFVVDFYKESNYAQTLAMMNLSYIDSCDSFIEVFKSPVNYQTSIECISNGKDCYGDIITDAPIKSVIEWLEAEIKHNDYRRLKPLLSMLKAYAQEGNEPWEDLRVIHYGY